MLSKKIHKYETNASYRERVHCILDGESPGPGPIPSEDILRHAAALTGRVYGVTKDEVDLPLCEQEALVSARDSRYYDTLVDLCLSKGL